MTPESLPRLSRLGDVAVRLRFVLMAVAGAVFATVAYRHQIGHFTDWVAFEAAARLLVNYHHLPVYSGHPFTMYARFPAAQFGPPSILPVAAMQHFSPRTVSIFFIVVMVALGLISVILAEATARSIVPAAEHARVRSLSLLIGVPFLAIWGDAAGWWHHLDDMLALTLAIAATYVIERQGAWWLAAAFLGTAAASKPWAIIFAPLLVAIPRQRRSHAVLVFLAVAGAWWAPFVLADTGTITSVSHFPVRIAQGTVLWRLGFHGFAKEWLRPLQFVGGIAVGLVVARRSDRAYLAAPLAALAVRVITDPNIYNYYGLGPLLFAALWDLTRPGKRRPTLTIATVLVEYVVAWLTGPSWTGPGWLWADITAYSKLAWGVGIVVALFVQTRSRPVEPRIVGEALPEGAVPPQSVVASTPSSISSVASRVGVSS